MMGNMCLCDSDLEPCSRRIPRDKNRIFPSVLIKIPLQNPPPPFIRLPGADRTFSITLSSPVTGLKRGLDSSFTSDWSRIKEMGGAAFTVEAGLGFGGEEGKISGDQGMGCGEEGREGGIERGEERRQWWGGVEILMCGSGRGLEPRDEEEEKKKEWGNLEAKECFMHGRSGHVGGGQLSCLISTSASLSAGVCSEPPPPQH